MSRKSFPKALDDALRPLGFHREGHEWIRVRGDMWECVRRDSSWLGGVTVNLAMKDLETEKLYLEIFAPQGAIRMPAIRADIGGLVDGYARWWKTGEPDAPADMAATLLKYGLPWFDKVRSLEDQAAKWYGRETALTRRGYHSPSMIGLALTLYRLGELGEACRVLRKPVPKTAIPTNVENVARVRDWLGCDAADNS